MSVVCIAVIIVPEINISLPSGFNPCKKLVLEEIELVSPLAVWNRLLAREGIDCADCLAYKLARLLLCCIPKFSLRFRKD